VSALEDTPALARRAAGRFAIFRKARVFAAAEVTTQNASTEVPAREVGLAEHDVEAIWESVIRLYETGLHPAVALCVRRHGQVVLDRAIGHTHGNGPDDDPDAPKRLATPCSLFNIYSASKAITAMLVHLVDERGLLHLDDPVAEYVPEFGRHGKEWVTIRHVLTHRAGIPAIPGKLDLALLADPKGTLERLCDLRPESAPGRRLAYHALTGGFVLAAVLERVTGLDVRELLARELRVPLGFRHLSYGVERDEVGEVAVNSFTGPPAIPPYSWMLERSLGVPIRQVVEISNRPEFLTAIVPSGNIVATANELGRFFELLLRKGELDGVRVFDRRTVQRAVLDQTFLEVDSILGLPVRYGMGFMLGGKRFSLYGADTPDAFGHVGFTNVVGWADPDRDVSAALMTNGKPFLTPGQLAWLGVARTIARVSPKVGRR
jgi:CubicO group peptidase (beta-lactamase class C family)